MINIAPWKVILTLIVCFWAFVYSAPNVSGVAAREWMASNLPSWLPNKTVNLGLDLQGGSHLLLEVDVSAVLKDRSESLVQSVRPELRKEKIGYRRIAPVDGGVKVVLRNPEQDVDKVKKIIRDIDRELLVNVSDDGVVEGVFSETAIKQIHDQTIEQSIEIVRRRIDETGTREPVIQRQGENRILVQLPGLDDPERVKQLLGRTAKLAFHLVDNGGGGVGASRNTITLPMVEYPGQSQMLQRRAMITGDMLTNARYAPDQNGQAAVSFQLNGVGAKRFCDVSRENVNRPFAIVLDKEIISAPVIREPLCGGSAQISGNFTLKEANDLALLLRAGALPAPLEVVEERTVGPSLGADSVEAGKMASIIGMLGIIIFMVISYGLFGLMADIALIVNMAFIFALLSTLQATLTLPGIAGIVLTIGMAVDANVLVFERIKEEVSKGRSIMAAIDTGYSRAMGTIIDSNLTTLIAAIILFSFGTGPIKGFAVTLAVGIITSFFSAIMVTRLMVVYWLKKRKPSELPI